MAITLPGGLVDKLRSPQGQKLFRYSVASAVAVIVSLIFLEFFYGVLKLTEVPSSVLATTISAIPNYFMNRKWAWGKEGKSHLWREVVPFWSLALIGLILSTVSVKLMGSYAKSHDFSVLTRNISVAIVYVGAFGLLWVGKFVIFNKVLFVHHPPRNLPGGLDGGASASLTDA